MAAMRVARRNVSLLAALALACGAPESQNGPDFGKGGGSAPPPPADPAIAYAVDGHNDQLMVMNADGTNQTSLLTTMMVQSPEWSPGGHQVAFGGGDGTASSPAGVYAADVSVVANIPRMSNLRLVIPKFQLGSPNWSPDGSQLVVTGIVEDGSAGIATVPAAGGALTVRFSASLPADGLNPFVPSFSGASWSPDGTRLAFTYGEHYHLSHDTSTLLVLTLATGHIDTLYNATPTSGLQQVLRPDWSPDGTRIVFDGYAAATDQRQLYTVPAVPGSQPRALPGTTGGSGAHWSPDGGQLVYTGAGVRLYTLQSGSSTLLSRVGNSVDWRR